MPQSERVYHGVIPTNALLIDTNGEWGLYRRPDKVPHIINLKLVSHTPCVGKANFYLSYDMQRGELIRTTCLRELCARAHLQHVYLWLLTAINQYVLSLPQ